MEPASIQGSPGAAGDPQYSDLNSPGRIHHREWNLMNGCENEI
jgi:hypothetical protein